MSITQGPPTLQYKNTLKYY